MHLSRLLISHYNDCNFFHYVLNHECFDMQLESKVSDSPFIISYSLGRGNNDRAEVGYDQLSCLYSLLSLRFLGLVA